MVAERDLLRHVAEYCTSHLVLCRMRYPPERVLHRR